MSINSFRRQFWKFCICIVLFVILFAAVQFFVIQTYVSRISLDYIEEQYSSIGTIVPIQTNETDPFAQATTEIPDQILELLYSSPYVSDYDVRDRASGLLSNGKNVFLSYTYEAYLLCMIDGFIDGEVNTYEYNGVTVADVAIDSPDILICRPSMQSTLERIGRIHVQIQYDADDKNMPELISGQRYLFTGFLSSDRSGRPSSIILIQRDTVQAADFPEYYNEIGPVSVISLESDCTESERYEILEGVKLSDYINQEEVTDRLVTVDYVRDMSLILPVYEENMVLREGRFLQEQDVGHNVCVISSELAQENDWEIGDTVDLGLSDSCYLFSRFDYKTGIPMVGERLNISYQDPEKYEIVGIYEYINYERNAYMYSFNNMFLPAEPNMLSQVESVKPYTLSFQVTGNDYDRFIQTTAKEIGKLGFSVRLSDELWKKIEPTYDEIKYRWNSYNKAALLSLIICCTVSVIVLTILFRREYSLRVLLGTSVARSASAYFIPLVSSSLVSAGIAVGIGLKVYRGNLFDQINKSLPLEAIPTDTDVLIRTIVVTASITIIEIGIQWLICIYQAHKSVRSLLNR